jgi:hypothetical protein
VYQFVQGYGLDEDFQQNRIDQLIELDENQKESIGSEHKESGKGKEDF